MVYHRAQAGRRLLQRVQRGRGIGSFLRPLFSLFSRAAPLVSKVIKSPIVKKIGKEVIKSGLNVTADAITGNNVKDGIYREVNSARKRVGKALKRASTSLETQPAKKVKKKVKVKNFNPKKKIKTRNTNLF